VLLVCSCCRHVAFPRNMNFDLRGGIGTAMECRGFLVAVDGGGFVPLGLLRLCHARRYPCAMLLQFDSKRVFSILPC